MSDKDHASQANSHNFRSGGIVKRTFLPKVFKQKLNSIGGVNPSRKDNRCPFPVRPTTKLERTDYAMIEESVLENERRGSFVRVYPNEAHLHVFRNFFEEERRNDTVLHNYVFNNKYGNMAIDAGMMSYDAPSLVPPGQLPSSIFSARQSNSISRETRITSNSAPAERDAYGARH